MRKSKHFRKDVIIARIIAAIILIILIVIIHSLISVLFKPSKNTDRDTQQIESEYNENEDKSNNDIENNPSISIDSESEEPSDSESEEIYVITTANVKLRQGPGTNYEVIGYINKDEKAILLEELSGWYKVSYNGEEGYISADYSEILE